MREVHLHYQSNPEAGEVNITVGYELDLLRSSDDYEFEQRATIQSSESSRSILDSLQKCVEDCVGENSSWKDMKKGQDSDKDPSNDSDPRYFAYTPSDTWSSLGDEEDPEERREVDEKNSGRHKLAFSAFRDFVDGYQNP